MMYVRSPDPPYPPLIGRSACDEPRLRPRVRGSVFTGRELGVDNSLVEGDQHTDKPQDRNGIDPRHVRGRR